MNEDQGCVIHNSPIYDECYVILSQHGFWHCYENRLIKTFQRIPHNLYVSLKLTSLYCGLRLILVYPNP